MVAGELDQGSAARALGDGLPGQARQCHGSEHVADGISVLAEAPNSDRGTSGQAVAGEVKSDDVAATGQRVANQPPIQTHMIQVAMHQQQVVAGIGLLPAVDSQLVVATGDSANAMADARLLPGEVQSVELEVLREALYAVRIAKGQQCAAQSLQALAVGGRHADGR